MSEGLTKLIQTASKVFSSSFNYTPSHFIQAPGRVNLIGEHTDYNDGFVLPCAIDYQTVVVAAPRKDTLVRVVALDYANQMSEFDLAKPLEFDQDVMWINYIKGVIASLYKRGFTFNGADIAVTGNVPQGAGLSSSAALEVVIGQTFKELYQLNISQQEIALNGQQAENEFVGCNCGIMDQLISAQGQAGHALLIDCRSLETKAVSMPSEMSIVIINSNKKRGLVDSEYNTRRKQCEQAAEFFKVKALRDVDLTLFEAKQAQLDPVVAKRARHVITENQRTLDAAQALTNNDLPLLASLMQASHESMRDDFEITCFEIDTLVNIVKDVIGTQGGVRMTGGGFGGCVVALVPPSLISKLTQAVQTQYQTKTGLKESIYICTAADGAGIVNGVDILKTEGVA